MPTKIAWTDESWNPVTGCTPISEGCAHCYAKKMTKRFGGDFSKVTLHPDRLEIPLHWRKPRMVFVPSMGDLFHEDVPDWFIWRVFWTMAQAQQHTFQVLTKRPERMARMLSEAPYIGTFTGERVTLPLPNVWLGVSVENQPRADERIPLLLETPAAVRFVSLEPLLGPLDLARYMTPKRELDRYEAEAVSAYGGNPAWGRWWEPPLDWVICGGESGGPPERRLVERCDCRLGPMAPHLRPRCLLCNETTWRPLPEALRWVRDIRDQCQAAGVPFFFKQWGPRAGQGTLLDGREHKEMPEVRA